MGYYGFAVTDKGRQLIAKLLAGEVMQITRVMFGSGLILAEDDIMALTSLIEPIAPGTSSLPEYKGGVVTMTVEYRSDLNGGLEKGFWLREFGIFANDPDEGEVMIYYATLGEYPQWVSPLGDGTGIDVRRFPISIAIGEDRGVTVDYNTELWLTEEDVLNLFETTLLPIIRDAVGTVLLEITIPNEGWTLIENPEDEYQYCIDVPIEQVKESHFPDVALHKASLEVAKEAILCPSVESLDGALRFWTVNIPAAEMGATAALHGRGADGTEGSSGGSYVLPVASSVTLGGIKVGNGLNITKDGVLSVDSASEEETDEMLEDIFGDTETTETDSSDN